MTQRNPIVPTQGPEARVTALHELCRADYAKGQSQRATPDLAPTYAAASSALLGPVTEPSNLTVAVELGHRMLATYGTVNNGDYGYAHGSLAEALRILLRTVDAEAVAAR